jgi:large subunit ribosomal protein L25
VVERDHDETYEETVMAEKITAALRTEFGKGAARRIRREHQIPAVVYGHGKAPMHLSLPGHETMMALKHGGANAVLELDIDGTTQLALAREVQVDPVRRVLEHIDFVAVRIGEKVTVDVPLHLVGDAVSETLVVTENSTVQVEAEATHIPEYIDVSIQGATVGTQIHAADLVLPEGTSLLTDPETLMVNVTQAQTVEQLEAELAEAEADAGIVHEAAGEETAEAEATGDESTEGEGGEPAASEGDAGE